MDTIRVLIVDDSSLMREALRTILEADPAIEVTGIARDGLEGVEKAFTAFKLLEKQIAFPVAFGSFLDGVHFEDGIIGIVF